MSPDSILRWNLSPGINFDGDEMFKKAEKSQIKFKMALTGPSGSGKTYSALLLAQGMGKKIALIDTENGSASLYAHQFDFDVLEIRSPYTTEKYIEAIQGAVKAGYDILIIDSITHAWAAEGGLLEQKEQLDSRGKGNSYTNWASITKKHEAFKACLLHSQIHLIATMRSKQDYSLEDDNGKKVPKKVGLAPIQRDGMEYEFTTVFDIAMNHEAIASKDRTGIFSGKIFKITSSTGEEILKWVENGKQVSHEPQPSPEPIQKPIPEAPQYISMDMLKRLHTIKNSKKWTDEQIKTYMKQRYNVISSRALSRENYQSLCTAIEDHVDYASAWQSTITIQPAFMTEGDQEL